MCRRKDEAYRVIYASYAPHSCPSPVCRACSFRHVRYAPVSHLLFFQNHASCPKMPSLQFHASCPTVPAFHPYSSCHLRLALSSFSAVSGTPVQSRSGQLSPPGAALPSRARNCPDRNTGSRLHCQRIQSRVVHTCRDCAGCRIKILHLIRPHMVFVQILRKGNCVLQRAAGVG